MGQQPQSAVMPAPMPPAEEMERLRLENAALRERLRATVPETELEPHMKYMHDVLVSDPDVPGLTLPKIKVVSEVTLGDTSYHLLEDGGLFVAHARLGQMVGFTLHMPDEVAEIRKVLGG